MNQTIELIKSHRSIRKFKKKKIEANKVEIIIEAGQSASTSSFMQSYSIIKVENEMVLKEISKIRKMGISTQPISKEEEDYIMASGLFLVFCADLYRMNHINYKKVNTDSKANSLDLLISGVIDASIAAQNVMIAAESLGLGGVFIGAIRNNPHKICELLEIPKYIFPIFGMSLGYPDQEVEKKPRLPMNVIFKSNKYNLSKNQFEIDDYDLKIKKYYENRSDNKKSITWSEQLVKKISTEQRAGLKNFLLSQEFRL